MADINDVDLSKTLLERAILNKHTEVSKIYTYDEYRATVSLKKAIKKVLAALKRSIKKTNKAKDVTPVEKEVFSEACTVAIKFYKEELNITKTIISNYKYFLMNPEVNY